MAEAKPKKTARDRYDEMLADIGPVEQAQLQQQGGRERDESESDFTHMAAKLPAEVREAIAAIPTMGRPIFPSDRDPCYCAVVCEDGEAPYLLMCPSAKVLAEGVGRSDGKDVYMYAFYGIPLPISQAPNRHLILPDHSAIRLDDGVVVCEVPENIAIESDGFMGPPELAVTTSRSGYVLENPVKALPEMPEGPKDEFEDDDDAEGAGVEN